MDAETATALIGAGASLAVAIVALGGSMLTARRANAAAAQQAGFQRDLEELRSRLVAENEVAKARRDYEYEARKRLYAELYPLAFQLHEACLAASNRVKNLARATRKGNLAPGPDNWLTSADPYYFNSALYGLLAPLAVYELMSRRLTLFDLNLDPLLQRQRFFAKKAYQCLRSDFDLSDPERHLPIRFDPADPQRQYAPPELPTPTTLQPVDERSAWRQGVYSGRIAQAVDALLVADGPDAVGARRTRLMSYAEFAKALAGADVRAADLAAPNALADALGPMADVLRDFHPARRPVTWRILLAQVACYRAILAGSRLERTDDEVLADALVVGEQDRGDYDWLDPTAEDVAGLGLSASELRAEVDSAIETANRYLTDAFAEYRRDYPLSRTEPP